MSKYRSRQVVEAFQWTGGPDQLEDPDWIVASIKNGDVVFRENLDEKIVEMRVTTIEGHWRYAKPGDWVVRTGFEHRYAVFDDELFRRNYEAVGDE